MGLFAARFSSLVGEPPLAYLTRWRMQSAIAMLSDGGLNVSEIAERVGYDSVPAFSKAFKPRLGVVALPRGVAAATCPDVCLTCCGGSVYVSTAAARSRGVLDARAARTAAASSRTPARITASEHRAYPSSSMDESSVRPRK